MKKEIFIDNINFDIYQTSLTTIAEEYLMDSRLYHQGLDYFIGSDCISVFIYLVEKTKTQEFIGYINNAISEFEILASVNETDDDLEYLESVDHFSFLHKKVDNSNYDLFISNFEIPMIQNNYSKAEILFEEFREKVNNISSFSIALGSTYDDKDMDDFSLSIENDVLNNTNESTYFKIVNNTPDNNIMQIFTEIYQSNIPSKIIH